MTGIGVGSMVGVTDGVTSVKAPEDGKGADEGEWGRRGPGLT